MAKVATLQEINEHWTLADLAVAHQFLDLSEEADEFAHAKQRDDAKRK